MDGSDAYGLTSTAKHRGVSRVLGGVLCGFVASSLLSEAIRSGASFTYGSENAFENWGTLVWGDHWILRATAAATAAASGGLIAGLVARRQGGITAILSSLPLTLIWTIIPAHPEWRPIVGLPPAYRFLAPALLVALPCIAFFAGRAGALLGEAVGPQFDLRPRTLLGIKWYHYIWIVFVVNAVAIENTWAGLYALHFLPAILKGERTMFTISVPGIFFVGLAATISLTMKGLHRAYELLAGFVPTDKYAFSVAKYAIGFPLVAAVLQNLINLLHVYLAGRLP